MTAFNYDSDYACACRQNKKVKEGNLFLTTHRILFYKGGSDCLEIPLSYVAGTDTCVSYKDMNTTSSDLSLSFRVALDYSRLWELR